MIRRFLPVTIALLLGACASAAGYAPASSQGGAGYSETRIEPNRYFVSYRAGRAADAAVIEDYALLRAAELTLANGRDWFWVDRRSVDTQTRRGPFTPSIGIGVGTGRWGRSSGVSVGVGVNIPVPLGGSRGPRATGATLEIRFGDGLMPDAPNAYDARAIAANLRAILLAPRAAGTRARPRSKYASARAPSPTTPTPTTRMPRRPICARGSRRGVDANGRRT